MALLHVNFFSNVLEKCMSMEVLLPQKTSAQIGMEGAAGDGKYPVLYLLHGMSDDETCWLRRTSIERYVSSMGIAVIMPNGDLSWYCNTKYNAAYWTYISEELPQICHEFFPNLSERREDTFVAGNSMGGYGAYKLALAKPERFCAAAALSGAFDIASTTLRGMGEKESSRWYWESLFGSEQEIEQSDNNILVLARKLKEAGKPVPKLYEWCGTEDFLYGEQKRIVEKMQELGYDICYRESPGVHGWVSWDEQIRHLLQWLPVRKW